MATYLSQRLGPRLGLAAQVRHRRRRPARAARARHRHPQRAVQPRHRSGSSPDVRPDSARRRGADPRGRMAGRWHADPLFPQTPAEAWREHADVLAPTFWDDGGWRIALQTWVVEVDGLTVLVDTGAGNDRDRTADAALDHLQTDFLDHLAARASTRPTSTSSINTHLHIDHVGWNTMRDDDAWVPTFSERALPDAGARLSPLPPGRPRADLDAGDRGGRIAAAAYPNGVRGQRITRRRADRVVVRRPRAQRITAVTARTGAHAGICRWCGWTRASRRCSSAT